MSSTLTGLLFLLACLCSVGCKLGNMNPLREHNGIDVYDIDVYDIDVYDTDV
jgi:hypothetical protein